MPVLNIEHPKLKEGMHEALKRHILRKRQRKRAKKVFSLKIQLENNEKNICELERKLVNLEQQKIEQYQLLKYVLNEENQQSFIDYTSINSSSTYHSLTSYQYPFIANTFLPYANQMPHARESPQISSIRPLK